MSTRTHHRACNLCEAICGLVIEVENDKVISIRGDKDDPLSRGHICPKAVALQDLYEDPDRLKKPVRRTDDGWEEISWEEAYTAVVTGLQKVEKDYGRSAIGIYLGNPNIHNYGSALYLPDFIRSIKTPNTFSATSADQLPHHLVAYWMFGHYFFLPVADVDRTSFMLILGANPLVSNGSLMTAPGFGKKMRAIQERGKVIVIDPRYSETATKADEHHFIRPGTDALLLLAMVQTLFAKEWVTLGHLEAHSKNLAELAAAVKRFTPTAVEELTGISAENIERITGEFVQAESAVCYGRMGVSTQEFGALCIWLVNLLNLLTGNFDKAGGAMFTSPAMDTVLPNRKGNIDRWRSRVSGYPERFGELPVAAMIEEMTTPGAGQIKAFVTSAGNPVLSTPNGQSLDKALAALDFMVSVDIYINETTKHANIILPPTSGLETSNYDVSFQTLAVRNTAKFSEACFEKTSEQRHDYEIFQELARRLRHGDYQPLAEKPEQMVDFALQTGAYGKTGLSLQQLKDQPSGVDLGPLQPVLPERLFTEDQKIDLAPKALLEDLERIAKKLTTSTSVNDKFPLLLIGRRQLRSNNSWMHNSERLVKGGERCTLLIHPEDAGKYGIKEGQLVMVKSMAGAIDIKAEIKKEMMPGVVSIPHGWGHARSGVKMKMAQAHPGVSINDLTLPGFVDELSGNAAFSGVPVSVQKG